MIAHNNTSVFLHTIFYVMNQSAIQQDLSYNYYYTDLDKVENETKCYGSYGCFPISPPWISENRPISLYPESLSKIEPLYLYYSIRNPTSAIYINLNDVDFVETIGMDPMLPTYIVTHGFMEGGVSDWISHLTAELLYREECNVIVVDWHGGSSPPYSQAVANIRLVGAVTAHLLAEMARYTGSKGLKHVHMIGHSLGAHMSGYVGYTLKNDFGLKLGRITGMDPAEPHFAKAAPPIRLDRSAADYVDVIHTDASAFIRGGLGITERIGHVDYYPNGGTDQPGCDRSISHYISSESGSFFRGMRRFLGCNHIRGYEFFIDSINPTCPYTTISCNSYQDFKTGKCFECGKNGQLCMAFGMNGRAHYDEMLKNKVIQPHHNLIQYLMTGGDKPFCRAHYRLTVYMSNSTESKKHGGEVGQLSIIAHSTRDGTGANSGPIPLNEGGYHGPNKVYHAVVAGNPVPHLKTIQVEWKFQSSMLNPLTWRLLQTPRIFVSKITVDSMELKESITVCPKSGDMLLAGTPQIMMSSYCV